MLNNKDNYNIALNDDNIIKYVFYFASIINDFYKLIKNKDTFNHGIDTRIAYPLPIYEQPFFKNKHGKFKKLSCKNSEIISSKILNLPIYPEMQKYQLERVIKSVISEVNNYS